MREKLIEPMLDVALKASKSHRFPNQNEAHLFMRMCFAKSLQNCGVFCPPKFKSEAERQIALKKLMTAANVKVEKNKQVLLGEWWDALYVYKRGELVSFITEPRMEKPSPYNTEKYPAHTVRTNVQL